MATITALANGTSFATGSSWVGGVAPGNSDTAVIGANCTGMIFDANQSAYANGITLICNGTLTAATTNNPYMKLAANITGTGNLTVGSSGSRYPGNCTMTFNVNGANVFAGPKLNFWCAAPTIYYARLVNSTPKAISGITIGNTTTINIPSHGYSVNDILFFYGVNGTTEINGHKLKVKSVPNSGNITVSWRDPNVDIDSSALGWTAYSSGGFAAKDNAAAANDTTLYLDRDVTSDPMWTNGATITIDNINRVEQSETRTLASVSAGNVTISSGLTAAKLCGSYVHLVTRNIRLIGWTGTTNMISVSTASGSNLDAEVVGTSGTGTASAANNISFGVGSLYNFATGFGGTNPTMTGGVITGGNSTASGTAFFATNAIISGGVISGWTYGTKGSATITNTIIAGCNRPVGVTSNVVVGNGTLIAHSAIGVLNAWDSVIGGTIRDCTYAINASARLTLNNLVCQGNSIQTTSYCPNLYIVNCRFYGHTFGLQQTYAVFGGNVTFSQGTTDLDRQTTCEGYGVSLNSATQVQTFITSSTPRPSIVIRDAGGVTGSVRGWTAGGRIVDDDGTNGLTLRLKRRLLPTSATIPVLWEEWLIATSGEILAVPVELKKDGTSWSIAPVVQLIDPSNDPLDGGTALATWTPTDNTTLQSSTIVWTATKDTNVVLRVSAANASGNLYFGCTPKQDQAPVGNVTSATTYNNGQLTGTIPLGNVTTGSGGTLNMANYTLISGVVSAANVLTGFATYSGGPTGTIPLGNVTTGSGGTLNMSLYTLKSAVVDRSYVYHTQEPYTGAGNGTLTLSNANATLDTQTYGIGGNGTIGLIPLGNVTTSSGGTLDVAAVEAAAKAQQLADDVAEADSNRGKIVIHQKALAAQTLEGTYYKQLAATF